MNKDSLPQIAEIEQPFGADPPLVHCPICGQSSITLDESGNGEVTPCPHLEFIYVGEVNDFEYMSDDFQEKLESADYEYLDFDNFQDVLAEAGYGNKLLALEITYGGMAGGPVYYTDIIGFDYNKI